jgi:NitT/TauT family transport system substrate-binding protein
VKKFYFLFALTAAFALFVLAGCGGDDSAKTTPTTVASASAAASNTQAASPAAAAKTRPAVQKDVTLGYTPLLINAPFYVGIDKGYFADEGINLKLVRIGPGADVLTQTAAGNFDIGSAGVGAAGFNLAAAAIKDKKTVPFEIVTPLHTERPPAVTPLVVSKARKDSGEITKISDLKGKKVAVNNRGSATEYWLNLALVSGGLTFNDVTVQAMAFTDMPAALANKSIDGAMLGEPLTTQAKDQNLIAILSDTFPKNEAPTAVYWNRDWATKNPDLAAGFLRAFFKAAAEMDDGGWDNAADLAIIEKATSVSADVIKRASRPHFDHQGKFDVAGWRALEAFFRAQGELTYTGDIDLNAFMRLK